jgi:hypothetical protein
MTTTSGQESGGFVDAGRAALRRAWLRASWLALLFNLGAGVLVLVCFGAWLSPWADGRAGVDSLWLFIGVFAVFVVVLGTVTIREDRRRLRVIEAWLDAGRPPRSPGWSIIMREPQRQAWSSWFTWLAGTFFSTWL